jgi:hypothetical protein
MRRKELAEERRERADNLEAPSPEDSFREHLPLAIHMGTPTTSSPPFLPGVSLRSTTGYRLKSLWDGAGHELNRRSTLRRMPEASRQVAGG